MSKIVFFCIPAHGHINPTIGVVKELISRGHKVWYYSHSSMREKIESSGATFVSCDDYYANNIISDKDSIRVGKDLAFSVKILVDTTLALDDMVCRDMAKLEPDCIVADSMALWGKAVALKLDIPFVSSNTTFAFNKHSAKIIKQGIVELIKMLYAIPKTHKQVERLKNKGYPVNSILDIIGSDDNVHTIVYTSPEFQPCSETFSNKYAFVGPSVRSSEQTIVKNKNKMIYISLGTVNNNMLHFYKTCISTFKNTDYQVIMSVGNLVSVSELGVIPENISVYPYVDQIAVLKQADVFISHCGMNSVSESLYFGVPLVMLPQTSEQKGVAERVYQLGAGVKLKKVCNASIRRAIKEVLDDFNYRNNAQKISRDFKNSSGQDGAADKIIEVCNNKNN